MDREQPHAEDLPRVQEVAHVAAREVAAAVAVASLFDGAEVAFPLCRLDGHVAVTREGRAVARHARGDHAVEHVHAARDALHHLPHHAEAHHVAGLRLGQVRDARLHGLVHRLLRLAHGDAADRVAGEVHRREFLRAVAADRVVRAALHDAEHELAGRVRRLKRHLRPRERRLHALRGTRGVARPREAFVEHHRDVACEEALHLHRLLRAEEHEAAVDVAVEPAPLRRELAHLREREHLEAAGVREDRTVPAHEAVETTRLRHHVGPRAQHEVVRVGEDHRGAVLAQVARLKRLHRGLGAHGHEHGRLDGPVRSVQQTRARA